MRLPLQVRNSMSSRIGNSRNCGSDNTMGNWKVFPWNDGPRLVFLFPGCIP